MSSKDKGSQKTTKGGGKDEKKETGATGTPHPKENTKPAVKKNYPKAEGAPRAGG